MNPLHVRLLTILRNLNAPATAADIRAKCQLPQDLELIHHALEQLCESGRALKTDIGLFAHRDYGQPEGLPEPLINPEPDAQPEPEPEQETVEPDAVALAPEEPPAAAGEKPEGPPNEPVVTKTDQVLRVLQKYATSWAQAMAPDDISDVLDGEISASRVSAILCGRRAAGNTPALKSRPAGGKKLEWVWIEGGAESVDPVVEREPQPVTAAEPSRTDQAAMDADLGELPRLADGDGAEVLKAIESMADSLRSRSIRDRALKVATLDGLARIAPLPVAKLLRRIVAEDLFETGA
jgi:hypothetical protein